TSPVLGFITSAVRVDCPAVRWPLMRCEICVVMSLPLYARYLDILVIVASGVNAVEVGEARSLVGWHEGRLRVGAGLVRLYRREQIARRRRLGVSRGRRRGCRCLCGQAGQWGR